MEREYIAYISYRHTPVDMEAAIAIQHQIEHYHIPKKLRKNGKARLGMVFRDTDELNISPDLSQSLREALDHSEYLIVLCSPQYKESVWCRQEITYFLEHHDMDHVLPILVNGDPYEAFPDELLRRSVVDGKEVISEPLAANVAGETIKELKQNIKREKLRIVAKLLNCHYDDLVQRQKHYERQKKIAVIGTAFAALLAFIVMLLVKNAQVNSRYQEARRNQARYLSTVALEQYQKGDAKSALESVLTILPEGNEKGPVVPEQMYALATVLNAYNNSYVPENFISLPERDTKVFSDDMAYLFSYSIDSLKIYDVASGEVQYSFEPSAFLEEHPELAENYPYSKNVTISGVIPAENDNFFVVLSVDDIFELNINDSSYYRCIVSGNNSIQNVCYQNGKLAFSSFGVVRVYDCVSGDMLYEKDFNSNSEETSVEYSIEAISWNEDASLLAVGFDYSNNAVNTNLLRDDPELNRQEEQFFIQNPPLGLVLIDPASGEITKLSGLRTTELSFAGNVIGAVHMEYLPYDVVCHNTFSSVPARWSAGIYDTASKECIYQSDKLLGEAYNFWGFSQGEITISDKARSVYSLWLGKTGIVLDAENHSILYMESFRADIVSMEYHRNAANMIILSNGSIQLIGIHEPTFMRTSVMKLDVVAQQAAKSGDQIFLITNTGLIQCGLSVWEDVNTVTSTEAVLNNYQAKSFSYFDSERGKLRLVGYDHRDCPNDSIKDDEHYSALELYPCLSDKAMFSYIVDDPMSSIKACNISKDGNHICILEQQAEGSAVVSGFNISEGTSEFRYKLPSNLTDTGLLSDLKSSGFSEDGKMLWITRKDTDHFENTVHIYELDGKDINLTEYKAENEILYPALTENGKHLVWMEYDSKTEDSNLVLLDLNTGKDEKVKLPERFEVDRLGYDSTLMPGREGIVLLYDKNTEVIVYDTEKAKFLSPIQVSTGSEIALLGNKTELLVAHEKTVSLYDLQSGELKSRLEVPYAPDTIITDSGSDIFALCKGGSYSSENDNGWFLGGRYLISIDEDRNMYLTAFIGKAGNYESISPSGGEIISGSVPGSFEFIRILSFEELVAAAS